MPLNSDALPKLRDLPTLTDTQRHQLIARLDVATLTDHSDSLHMLALCCELLADKRALSPIPVRWVQEIEERRKGIDQVPIPPPPEEILQVLISTASISRLYPEDHDVDSLVEALRMSLAMDSERYASFSLEAEHLLEVLAPPVDHLLFDLLTELAVCDLEIEVPLSELSDLVHRDRATKDQLPLIFLNDSVVELPGPSHGDGATEDQVPLALLSGERTAAAEQAPPRTHDRNRNPWLARRWWLVSATAAMAAGLLLIARQNEQEHIATPDRISKGTGLAVLYDSAPPPGELVLSNDQHTVRVDLSSQRAFVVQGESISILWIGAPDGAQLYPFYETGDGQLHPFLVEDGNALVLSPGDARELRFDEDDRALIVIVAWSEVIDAYAQQLGLGQIASIPNILKKRLEVIR